MWSARREEKARAASTAEYSRVCSAGYSFDYSRDYSRVRFPPDCWPDLGEHVCRIYRERLLLAVQDEGGALHRPRLRHAHVAALCDDAEPRVRRCRPHRLQVLAVHGQVRLAHALGPAADVAHRLRGGGGGGGRRAGGGGRVGEGQGLPLRRE